MTNLLIPNITITILDIINRPVFYLQHDVSETERLQMEPNQMVLIEGVSLCLRMQRPALFME
jgi:hypothetical protein